MSSRVAFVSVPFRGHVSVLEPLWRKDENSHLFLLCFEDFTSPWPQDIRQTEITLHCKQPSENAEIFNTLRSKALTDALHVFLYDFYPTLIVYDFFCLEAREVARKLGIPAICSIPAILAQNEQLTCSDALLPKEHMYWLWKHPYKVSIRPVKFLGPRIPLGTVPTNLPKNAIFVSFGSVVPRYPGCADRLNIIMDALAQYATKHTMIFGNLSNFHRPHGIFIEEEYDQLALFREIRPSLFIFHGGGNSYTEALQEQIPMLVIPFFGDQFHCPVYKYSGDFEHDIPIAQNIVSTQSITNLSIPFDDTIIDYYCQGDLIFGHSRHREALQEKFPSFDMHLGHYAPFHTFGSGLPVIADVYNDEIDNPGTDHPYGIRWNQLKRDSRPDLPHEHRLVYHCLEILKKTLHEWNNKILFVLGPMDELGIATKIELDYIESNNHDSILFFDIQGKRIPSPFSKKIKKVYKEETIIARQSRTKTQESIEEKQNVRKLPVMDIIGIRYSYINRETLDEITIPENYQIRVITNDMRVYYYYYLEECKEIQVWPIIYLLGFLRDSSGKLPLVNRLEQRNFQNLLEK